MQIITQVDRQIHQIPAIRIRVYVRGDVEIRVDRGGGDGEGDGLARRTVFQFDRDLGQGVMGEHLRC